MTAKHLSLSKQDADKVAEEHYTLDECADLFLEMVENRRDNPHSIDFAAGKRCAEFVKVFCEAHAAVARRMEGRAQ